MSYTHALGRVAELFQKVQQLETELAALRRENAVFRSLLIQAVLRYESPHSSLTEKHYIARAKTALGEDKS